MAGSNASVAVSSFVIVRVRDGGSATPRPPVAVAATVTALPGATTSLSCAATVTTPVLAIAPTGMVSVVPVCVKSAATAGATGVVDTVSVTASLDAVLSVAVTVLDPPFSLTDDGLSTSDTAGTPSLSRIVRV